MGHGCIGYEEEGHGGRQRPPQHLVAHHNHVVVDRVDLDHLLALGYDVFYSESAGDHSWPYWDQQIALAIPRLLGKEAKQ